VELSPDAVATLRPLKVEIAGLAPALSGHPLFAMAGGVDLPNAQQVGVAIAGNLKQLGTACGLGPLVDGTDSVAHAPVGSSPRAAVTSNRSPARVSVSTGGAMSYVLSQRAINYARQGESVMMMKDIAQQAADEAFKEAVKARVAALVSNL